MQNFPESTPAVAGKHLEASAYRAARAFDRLVSFCMQ